MAWILEKPRPVEADRNPFPELHLLPRAERVVQLAGKAVKFLTNKYYYDPIHRAEERVRGAEQFLSDIFAQDDGEAWEPGEL